MGGRRGDSFPGSRRYALISGDRIFLAGMVRVRVHVMPAAFLAALIMLWAAAVYLGFFLLPSLPFSPFGVFILFLTVLA